MEPNISEVDSCHMPGKFRNPVFYGVYSFNTGKIHNLTTTDYAVVLSVLMCTFIISFYQGWQNRKMETVLEFLLAYRSMPGVPMGASIMAGFASGITILGTVAETYDYSTMYSWIGWPLLLMAFVTAHIFHPVFYKLNLITSYQYLELRFDRAVRTVAATYFIFKMVLYLSLVLYAPTAVFQKVVGLSLWSATIYMGIICILATAFGGMRGIVWADVFQVVIIFASLLVVLKRAVSVVGSWDIVREVNARSKRLIFDDYRLEYRIRHSIWSLIIGGFLTYSSFFTVTQNVVQKTNSCNTLKDAKIAVYTSVLLYIAINILCCLIGLCVGTFYENCDPLIMDLVENSNQLFPLFVMDILPDSHGLAGLFVSGLLCATLSTLSSGLSAVTASILEDFMGNCTLCNISVEQARFVAQCIVLVYGVLCLIGTYVASQFNNILEATLSLYGLVSAPVFGVFILGLLFPCANAKGAMFGLLGSTALMLMVAITSTFSGFVDSKSIRCTSNCQPDFFNKSKLDIAALVGGVEVASFRLSYLWYAPVAVASCILIGLIVSFATGKQDSSKLDRGLYVLVCDEIFPFFYLPESFRKRLRPVPKKNNNCAQFCMDTGLCHLFSVCGIGDFSAGCGLFCPNHELLRKQIWPDPTPMSQKLYGSLEDLRRTAAFVVKCGETI